MRILFAIITTLSLVGCFPDCSSLTPEGNLDGRINSNSGHCDYNHAELTVNSGGGDVTDAINIANYIVDAEGVVTVDGQCSSACALLLSAAPHRIMCHDSWVGLHQGNRVKATSMMMRFFAEDDRIDYNWLDVIITNTPHEEAYWLSAYDAIRIGLADEIVTCE